MDSATGLVFRNRHDNSPRPRLTRQRGGDAHLNMKDLNLSNVAVIGGGRWGLVICSALKRLLPETVSIWLVSRRMPAERVPGRVRRIFDVSGLPDPERSGAAVVATAPHDHPQTALRCLAAGWHVLVEKPFALDLGDARASSNERPN
jgi:predicted dehydrogenase